MAKGLLKPDGEREGRLMLGLGRHGELLRCWDEELREALWQRQRKRQHAAA